jgi:hypothetical protein
MKKDERGKTVVCNIFSYLLYVSRLGSERAYDVNPGTGWLILDRL